MEKIVIAIAIYTLIIFIDLIPIFKKKNKKVDITYIVIILITFTIIFLDGIEIKVPSPSLFFKSVIDSFIK
jgi:hypothetical protein